MPFVTIRSLPLAKEVPLEPLLKEISLTVAEVLRMDLRYVAVTWSFFSPGHYMEGGEAPLTQPSSSHPPLVEIHLYGGRGDEEKGALLTRVADVISQGIGLQKGNVFITLREAIRGETYDQGVL